MVTGPGLGKSYHLVHNTGRAALALDKRLMLLMAASSMMVSSCATPAAHDDGYPLNPWGQKARETDKQIRDLENERDALLHAGVTTQGDVARKLLLEKRIADLYNKKLGRTR